MKITRDLAREMIRAEKEAWNRRVAYENKRIKQEGEESIKVLALEFDIAL